MARWPVEVVRVSPHGAFNYPRARRRHHGVDLVGKRGTVVSAPERMRVLIVARGTSTSGRRAGTVERDPRAPIRVDGVRLDGYGPAAVLGLGLDTGLVLVLGHLADGALPAVGQQIDEGGAVGTISGVGHVHFEVRKPDAYPWPRNARGDDTYDPEVYIAAANRLPFSAPAAATLTDRVRAAVRTSVERQAAGEIGALVLLALAIGACRR